MPNMTPADFIEIAREFTQQLKEFMEAVSKNKRELRELKNDAKKLVEALYNLSKRENMETFRKFARELERFNNNAEILIREMNELKKVTNSFNEVAKNMSDIVTMLKGD